MVLAVKPIGEYLGRGLEEDMEEGTIFTEVRTEFFGDGKNNMAMPAIDELERNGISTVSLISSAAGIAESGMTAKRDELVGITVRADVKVTAEIRVTAADDLLNFSTDNRTNLWIFQEEDFPVIRKDLLNGKLGTHTITWFHFTVLKKLLQLKKV